MKKKIGIIGQFPPPMHGLSKALDTLYNSYLQEEFNLKKIDIKDNKKFFLNLLEILFSKLDLYYLTISQSKFGNLRDLIIIKLIQMKRRKIVIHLHGGGFRNILDNEFSNIQKKLNYKILSKVDAGIVLGDSLRYIFEGIIPKEKIYVVKNCVDDEFVITDDEFKHKISSINNKKYLKVLYLSNFIEEKGYKDVLELARITKENNCNKIKFIFAGKFFNDLDKKMFYEYIKKYDLDKIVDYRGVVTGNKKLNLLIESDLFILLTRYKNEGQPISIIEAAANGLFIISTNHAGIKDILSEDEMIELESGNYIEINKVYAKINELENKKDYILKQNRKKILLEFSQQKYLKSLQEIFSNI